MKHLFFIILVSMMTLPLMSQDNAQEGVDMAKIEEGKKLFKTNCKSCHHLTQRLTGPPLLDVENRQSKEWIVSFVQSSQSVIKSGDNYADSLYKAYNSVLMPDQALNEGQISNILEYFKFEKTQAQAVPAIQRPAKVLDNYFLPLKFSDAHWWLVYTLFFLTLIWGLYVMIDSYDVKRQYD